MSAWEHPHLSVFQNDFVTTDFRYRERANSWQFPLLGKYYFRPRGSGWEPFIGTGYTLRTIRKHVATNTATKDAVGNVTSNSIKADYGSGLGVGAAAAAGVRFHKGRIGIISEFRYTRWSDSYNNLTPRNDVKFLMGITF